MQDSNPFSPPSQLVRLLSKIPTRDIVWPGDSDEEFYRKQAYMKVIVYRLNLSSGDLSEIESYVLRILATNDYVLMADTWHSLVGYVMSVGNGPPVRKFFSDLLRAIN